jgi:serine/threonine-protein kinase
MLIGQKLGPFLVEKELGAGAMGAVYLATYVKTGQKVAIKVMSPNMGSSNPSSLLRFEREANILKQLKHPNIVRLYGIGKHQGMPYYAMELIQGETLDRTMARRDRMTWEQVVDLGKQLCSALQHAHEAGVVHRDLKPSNLMILADGTIKLTDFGIAKDLDVTQLTATNSTVGTAAYMSPEQCTGKEITFKSDLYSLGIVFYELLTGRKPFQADNAVDMFMLHIQGQAERPSRLVPDLPVWMDNLVMQLMEKKPEQRPRDAAMVADVLSSIQEKVEAQASAGAELASARRGDLPKGTTLSEEDKDAARSMLGKKPKKKKKKDATPGALPVWAQAAGLGAALVAVIALIAYAMMPPSAQSLYDKAEKLVAAGNREAAVEEGGPVRRYLALYGKNDDDMTRKMREWADDHAVAEFEKIMARHVANKREGAKMAVGANNDDEKHALDAAVAEYDGDRKEAERLWKLVSQENARVGPVARRHLLALDSLTRIDQDMQTHQERATQARGDIELDALQRLAFEAWRRLRLGDRLGASEAYTRLRTEARKTSGGPAWALYAAVSLRAIKPGQTEEERVSAVSSAVDRARKSIGPGVSLLPIRATLHDVVSLYGDEPALGNAVREAREGIARIDMELPPK